MGFSWADTITANSTVIKAAHANELQTNIDTDRVSVELAGYAWTRTPLVANSHKVLAADFTEMMTALDQAYDANTCSSHNVTHYGTHYNNEHKTYNNTYNTSNLSTDNTSHLTTHDASYKATHNNGYYGTHNGIFDASL